MKKRILINLMLFGPGGGVTHLLYLCSALVQQGAEVTLIARHARRTAPLIQVHKQIPIRVVTTPFAENRRLYRLSTLWALLVWPFRLGLRKYDVLYTWEVSRFTRFLSLFIRREGYVLLQRAGEPLSEESAIEPSLEKLLDGLVVETPMQADAARQTLRSNIPILALPQLGHCSNAPARQPGSSNGIFKVSFLGRYHSDKGIYRLLEIWPRLNAGPVELNCYAWGPERDQFKLAVNDGGLAQQIHLQNPYSTAAELAAILAKTDLLVLPSETEGLPVVLLESMAHGVPFVATDVGAVRTLAAENSDVRVVPLDNDALREAIEQMINGIRSGQVRGDRLQTYYQTHYGTLTQRWVEAFLNPEQFFTKTAVDPLDIKNSALNVNCE